MSRTRAFHRALTRPQEPTRSCAASSCREGVTVGRIFCRNHWFALPLELRDRMLRTFFDGDAEGHQDAVREGCDLIDGAVGEGAHTVSALLIAADGTSKPIRYLGRMIA